MELDLNQESLDRTGTSVTGFDSMLNELESVHGHIEDRIRHLEAVTSRARQRQRRWRGHTPIQITNITGGFTTADVQYEGMVQQEEVGFAVQGRTVDSGEKGKRKSTFLIAKALEMDTDANKAEGSTGNLFDCNMCLNMARDPVLTCCGHLFCWPCFYQLSYAYSNVKECPVCQGEVTETGITPIYGNAIDSSSCQLELKKNGSRVPPRPHASRIESFTQQLISQGESSSAIQEIRWFNNFIGGLGERFQLEIPEITTDRTDVMLFQSPTENNQHTHSHQFSRLLVQGAASFSSLSSALTSAMDSAERLVEDLQAYIYSDHSGRNIQLNPHAVNRESPFSIAATNQSDIHTPDVAATNSTAVASVSHLIRNGDATAVIDSEIQTTDSSAQISSSDTSSSSSRRTDDLRLPNIDNGVSNEPRRRRLR